MAEGDAFETPGEQIEHAMARVVSQFGAITAEAMRPERWEYRLVSWEQVNELAADGWELRAAHIDLTRFVMARKRGAADEAADLLAAARYGIGQMLAPPASGGVRLDEIEPLDGPEDGAGGLEG